MRKMCKPEQSFEEYIAEQVRDYENFVEKHQPEWDNFFKTERSQDEIYDFINKLSN